MMGLQRVVYVRDWCREVKGTNRLVLYALASRCGDEWQWQCSQAELAADTGLTTRTIRSCILELVDAGYITVSPEIRQRGRPVEKFTYRFVSDWKKENLSHYEETERASDNGRINEPLSESASVLVGAETEPFSVIEGGKTEKNVAKTERFSALKRNKGDRSLDEKNQTSEKSESAATDERRERTDFAPDVLAAKLAGNTFRR